VRGFLVALYLLARGVTTASATAAFAVALVLALAGALIAPVAPRHRRPRLLTLLGAALLVAAVLLALIRKAIARLVVVGALFVVDGRRLLRGASGARALMGRPGRRPGATLGGVERRQERRVAPQPSDAASAGRSDGADRHASRSETSA